MMGISQWGFLNVYSSCTLLESVECSIYIVDSFKFIFVFLVLILNEVIGDSRIDDFILIVFGCLLGRARLASHVIAQDKTSLFLSLCLPLVYNSFQLGKVLSLLRKHSLSLVPHISKACSRQKEYHEKDCPYAYCRIILRFLTLIKNDCFLHYALLGDGRWARLRI